MAEVNHWYRGAGPFISALSHVCVPAAVLFGLSSWAIIGKSHLPCVLLIIYCAITSGIARCIFPENVTHKVEDVIWAN